MMEFQISEKLKEKVLNLYLIWKIFKQLMKFILKQGFQKKEEHIFYVAVAADCLY